MNGKLHDKINQRCVHLAMCLKAEIRCWLVLSQGFPQGTYSELVFSSLLQFSFKCFNNHNSNSLSPSFFASGKSSILYGFYLWFAVILEAFPLTKIKKRKTSKDFRIKGMSPFIKGRRISKMTEYRVFHRITNNTVINAELVGKTQ